MAQQATDLSWIDDCFYVFGLYGLNIAVDRNKNGKISLLLA